MRSLQTLVLTTIGLLAMGACTPPVADTAADVAAFRDGTKTWIDAYYAGDADRIVALYTADAVLMPPDVPLATGHEAIHQFLVANIASSKASGVTLVLGEESGGVSGDLGWH